MYGWWLVITGSDKGLDEDHSEGIDDMACTILQVT